MQIQVQKSTLTEALQKLSSIIGSRTTLPILNNVLLKTEGDFLVMETTDLDIRITTKIPAVVEKQGASTVPVKRLLMFVRDFKDEKINISSNEGFNLNIDGTDSHYELLGTSPEEFPVPPTIIPSRRIVMSETDLYRHLSLVSYAVSTDEARKVLNGVLLSVKSNIFVSVATDGKRLAVMEKPLEKFEGKDGDAVIHARVAAELMRIMNKTGNVDIEIGEKMIIFRMGDTVLSSKIMEGTFPNYRQVISPSFSRKIEINREGFYAALRRIINVISDSNPLVELAFSADKVTLTAKSAEIGVGREVFPIKYSGSDVSLLLNPHNLSDPLKVITSDNFIFQMNDGHSPISLLGDEGFIYIMMPFKNK